MENAYKILKKIANVLIVINVLGIGLTWWGHPWGKIYKPGTWWLLVVIWIIMAIMNKTKKGERKTNEEAR